MVRRHTPRDDVHIAHTLDGATVSDECIEAGKAGGGVGKHEYACDGYVRVFAGYRVYCECWCHEWEAEGLEGASDE